MGILKFCLNGSLIKPVPSVQGTVIIPATGQVTSSLRVSQSDGQPIKQDINLNLFHIKCCQEM